VAVLDRLRRTAPAVLDREPVVFAYLFGSQATGTAGPRSDVDVAVYLEEAVPADAYLDAALRIARRLEEASRVGPIEAVVVLNEAPLPLAGRIRLQRQVVYSRDEPARVAYESRTARMFHDFQLRAERRDLERLRAIAEGRR
jgi:predicted nucleotidyltransferase